MSPSTDPGELRAVRRYLLLGWPVSHSLSPRMQNAALRAAGLDAVYEPLAVRPEELPEVIAGLRAAAADGTFAGANVTAPHKQTVMRLLDGLDRTAENTAAVNTIVVRPGPRGTELVGANTDVEGMIAALAEEGIVLAGSRVLVVGAGGMARAAIVAALVEGACAVRVACRRPDAAASWLDALAERWEGTLPFLAAASLAGADAAETDVLVHATPLGRDPQDPLPIGLERASASLFVLDAVYADAPTPLVKAARRRGLGAADGRGLLLHQGAAAFALWTGLPAPVAAMRSALGSCP